MLHRLALAAAFAFAGPFVLFQPGPVQAQEETLEVTVDSGRTFVGRVDRATSDRELVLRSGSDRAWITRTLEWSRVTAGTYEGETLTGNDLRAVAELIKSPAPVKEPNLTPVDRSSQASPTSREAIEATQFHAVAAPPVIGGITFDAVLANWDGDVEADGLLIYLQPFDQWGSAAEASGSVTIELYASERRVFHHAPQSGGNSQGLIARWTCAVTPADFGPRGAVLKFPFAAKHPEFTDRVSPYGLVHVRMNVPGSGTFEHSADAVRIRPYAPTRDALQLGRGQRFFANERTGRGKTSYPAVQP